MQKYTKIQKNLSFLLIFTLLFSFTINISFFSFVGKIFAGETSSYNVVSIFVQEEMYDDVKSEVKRYASDIQGVLQNTKTLIIPVSSQEHPFNIASLIEKLYYDGYDGIAGLSGESKLIGTVFVGDVALPVVENAGNYEKTIFPYTDFENKLYVFDQEKKSFVVNPDFSGTPKAEIWQGFISPNTGDLDEDVEKVITYFDKNHDFYAGKGNYDAKKGVTNGVEGEKLDTTYEPYVLYYDQVREFQALNYVNFQAYNQGQKYTEDLVYDRYSKELANTLQQTYTKNQGDSLGDLGKALGGVDLASLSTGPKSENVPDILTRHIINNSLKQFPQVFNTDTLGQFRKDVHNAGRYNTGSTGVGVDLIPQMIANMDIFSQSIIKNVNTDLETEIKNLVTTGLARDMAVLTNVHLKTNSCGGEKYVNFFYGTQASSISSAQECSIYRGNNANSGTLVESNRAFNLDLVQNDVDICTTGVQGYWGGNTPLNIDKSSFDSMQYKLLSNDPKKSIVPLYDIKGQVKSDDNSKLQTPLNCYDNGLILVRKDTGGFSGLGCSVDYEVPFNGGGKKDWNCKTVNSVKSFSQTFDQVYSSCSGKSVTLDGKQVCGDTSDDSYTYKKISSVVEHVSPTQEELRIQVKNQKTPNLAVDKDRFIDFITPSGKYEKIVYPFLFRLKNTTESDLSPEVFKFQLKTELTQKSTQINTLITTHNPASLSGKEKELYELLKNGNYPQANIDLYNVLLKKPKQKVNVLGDEKELTYIDMLAMALYWNNLPSVSSKYKFIYDYQMGDQLLRDDFAFFLPKNKKLYEMSYMVAPGDGNNMFVKMDGEDKGTNPYVDLISQNLQLQNALELLDKNQTVEGDTVFKCSPPDGVPLQEWLPAINCWIDDMMDSDYGFKEGSCGPNTVFDFEESSFFERYDGQGIIEFLKSEFYGGYLKVTSESPRCGYNKNSQIQVEAYNKDNDLLAFDNYSQITFQLAKVDVPENSSQSISQTNTKTIYDDRFPLGSPLFSDEARKEVAKYIDFKETTNRLNKGKTTFSYTSKNRDANVEFRVKMDLRDEDGNILTQKTEFLQVQIRGDALAGTLYNLHKFNGQTLLESGVSGVEASNAGNVFLLTQDLFTQRKNNLSALENISSAQEKLFVTLVNQTPAGKILPLELPVQVTLSHEEKIVKKFELSDPKKILEVGKLSVAGKYSLDFVDKYGQKTKKDFSILPAQVARFDVNLGTNLMEKDGVVTSHMVSLYDSYDNRVSGRTSSLDVSIDGGSVEFEDGTTSKTFHIFEGYKKFTLKTTSKIGAAKLNFTLKRDEASNLTLSKNLQVVDAVEFDVAIDASELRVGGNTYNYRISAKNISEVSQFQSRAYLVSDSMYVKNTSDFVNIVNNTGTGSFTTTGKAAEKFNLQWQIEGVKKPVLKEISLLPDLPIRVNLLLDKSTLEASPKARTQLRAELKDRYGNTVFTDNASQFSLEVDEKYQSIIELSPAQKLATKGKASFIVQATEIPGTAYFKVSTTPSLESNVIQIAGQTAFPKSQLNITGFKENNGVLSVLGNTFFYEYDENTYRSKFTSFEELQSSSDYADLSLSQKNALTKLFQEKNTVSFSGISQNVGKIETYYFWNEEKLKNTYHNSLYATLLGSNYGDITQKNNLSNALIFEPTSKTLGVTSMLSNVKKQNEVLKISTTGNVGLNLQSSDLTQDVSQNISLTQNGDLEMTFFNNTFGKLIAKIFLNLRSENLVLKNCTSANFANCFDTEKTTAALYTYGGEYIYSNNEVEGITLKEPSGKTVFALSPKGVFLKATYTQLSLNPNHTGYGAFDIQVNGKTLATLAISAKKSKISVFRDFNQLDAAKLTQSEGGYVVYLEGLDYFYKKIFTSSSTKESTGISVVYNDPFASDSNEYSPFVNQFDFGYEFALKQKGLGWGEKNKTLLGFAAGKNIGETTQDYASFSLINIGDPVVSLKNIPGKLPDTEAKRKFDPTIGKLISSDPENIAFNTFDYNNDGFVDMVLLKKTGFVELLEGTGDPSYFYPRGNLVHIVDFKTSGTIETGDFTGDGYEDFVFLNKNGEVLLFNNAEKDFVRLDMKTAFALKGRVMQVFSFDMDADGIDDIVTYDDSGEINIFYGGGTALRPKFTKKTVVQGWGAKLSDTLRNDNGLIYFSGMYQLPKNAQDAILKSSEELQAKVTQNISNLTSGNTSQKTTQINEPMIDNIMFRTISYTHPTENNIPTNITDFDSDVSVRDDQKTFIKSEYIESEGLRVNKKYIDLNAENLQSGDEITLDIQVQNISSTGKQNIVYLEKIPEYFEIDTQKQVNFQIGGQNFSGSGVKIKSSPSAEYAFLIDSYEIAGREFALNLAPGSSFSLQVPLKTKAFQSGYIEVGLFEAGEPGDDEYGDISYKMKQQSCGSPYKMLRSTASRSYSQGEKALMCEKELPDEIAKNGVDADKNGIPDYIDTLIADGKAQNNDYKKFAQDGIDALLQDSDGDGIPDDEDLSPYYNDDENFMSKLDQLNTNVDLIVEGMDNIFDGFSCGFGGGGCISTPLNWAPLAPGGDPVLFGMPIGDGLSTYEGLPAFSAVTSCGLYPGVWPPCSLGAGGMFGFAPGPFRLFVTPTLTGAMGVAMCFGDNTGAGYSPMPGLSPLTPGGNCIVLAKPFLGCKNDGSDGEIYNVALPTLSGDGFGVINGNCEGEESAQTPNFIIPKELAGKYLTYKRTGYSDAGFLDDFKDLLLEGYTKVNTREMIPEYPLVTFGEGNDGSEFSLTLDNSSIGSGDFGDIISIQMERVAAFPDFLMDWVRRQIEEIVGKLTSFPTLFIVLPDFSGVFDGFENFSQNAKTSFEEGKQERAQTESTLAQRIENIEKQKSQLNCESDEDKVNCLYYDTQIANLQREKSFGGTQTMSGIRGVYEFLGSLPMISVSPEVVNVNIPWIDQSTVNKVILEWELTSNQRKEEWKRVKEEGGWNKYTCVGTPSDPEECRTILNMENLIVSLDRNIEILKSYKEFPQELNELLRVKELRLEQILCNVEIISEVLGGWIGENGERFRAWVELYILVKAVLKSWQTFIDIFLDYEAECHQCKNERNDLQYFIWKLISAVIPSMPVIQFPKWPDIYMDLHNIRVGLQVSIPDFHFNLRPILIPNLPNLYLPDAPYVNMNIPELPILPEFEVPELPEIPSLPSVELPDLPPPPKLPRLFSSLDGFLNILKLITKAMCILKTSPFVPEWRAGDQIAFLTERSGFLPTDFIDLSLPQFSYSSVDAIKITTWVNLEFETEFLTEAARQATLPFNIFTNNIVNYLDIGIEDVDLTRNMPSEINIDVQEDGTTDNSIGQAPQKGISVFDFAMILSKNIPKLYTYLEKEGSQTLSPEAFKSEIQRELAKPSLIGTPGSEELRSVWKEALNYSFQKENALIKELKNNNAQKFQELESILHLEIENAKREKKELEEKMRTPKTSSTLISSTSGDFEAYNKKFEPYNSQVRTSALNLYKGDSEVAEIRSQAESISQQLDAGLTSFEKNMGASDTQFKNEMTQAKSQILAMAVPNTSPTVSPASSVAPLVSSPTPSSAQSCKIGGGSGFTYKGIYIVEKFLGKNISYRLFDYTDELTGKEIMKQDDADLDGDEDVFYMVGSEIYFKENMVETKLKVHYTGNPIELDSSDILEYMVGEYLPAVNNFHESIADSGYINLSFQASSDKKVSNYRIEFFDIVDKMSDQAHGFAPEYVPVKVKKRIIDAFSAIKTSTLDMEISQNSLFTLRKNLAYIDTIGNLGGVEMYTKEMKNISGDLNEKKQVIVNNSTQLYAGSNDVNIVYYPYADRENAEKYQKVTLKKYSNIQFSQDIVLVSASGELYVEGDGFITLRGNQIISYVKKPLFPGTKIQFIPHEMNKNSGITSMSISYFDGTQADLDFERIVSYELYDLGEQSNNYLVRTALENNYYYAKIQAFQRNIFSAWSAQTLLSPQKESDTLAPNLQGLTRIRVPVYQQKEIDITEFVYENSGMNNLKNIFIDFDLTLDTSGDGNNFNDPDMYLGGTNQKLQITNFARTLKLKVGPFDELFTKKIRIYLVDQNNNIGYKDVDFEVYAPVPNISKISGSLIEGKIDEKLENEPITLYRLRGGSLERLATKQNERNVPTNIDGNFTFIAGKNEKGIELTYNNKKFASVNEDTGKIQLVSFGDYDIIVYPSGDVKNTGVFPKIVVLEKGLQIYEQYLVMPDVGVVQSVTDFIEVVEGKFQKSPGVYYRNTSDQYASYTLPLGIAQNAGDMIIYDVNDKNKTPVALIFKDGRIEVETGMFLDYTTYGEYVVLKLMKQGTSPKEVGRVLLIPEANFVEE